MPLDLVVRHDSPASFVHRTHVNVLMRFVRSICKHTFVQIEGAHIRERAQQGGYIDWWVVVVQRSVLSSESAAEAFARTSRCSSGSRWS
jgi:hypothetical protein